MKRAKALQGEYRRHRSDYLPVKLCDSSKRHYNVIT
jgi:hypothetical protein